MNFFGHRILYSYQVLDARATIEELKGIPFFGVNVF